MGMDASNSSGETNKELVGISCPQRELTGQGQGGGGGECVLHVGALELYTYHRLNGFPKCPLGPERPLSSNLYIASSLSCTLFFPLAPHWERRLSPQIVGQSPGGLSPSRLPCGSPPRACLCSVPPASTHSLPQPLLPVPRVPAPAQASSSPACQPPPRGPAGSF